MLIRYLRVVQPETFYMRCEGCIRHHDNRRWRQIRIQVCNAERLPYNAARLLMYKHLQMGVAMTSHVRV